MHNKKRDCNYNEFYEKIKRRIEEENKNIKYRYIQGPPGEKGEKGDSGTASISIGKVETVDASCDAEVINVGTSENVILDFKIPRGECGEEGPMGLQGATGEKGDLGPMGPQGEKGDLGPAGPQGEKGEKGETGPAGEKGDIGVSETIVVDETETIDSTEKANVIDKLENNIHHLTFYIPKGETGPMGPGAGSTSFNSIISVRYADATDSRALTIKEKTFIPDPTSIFTVSSTINIDVNVTGIYEIVLCGKISGVTEENGAKFYLINIVTGEIINNLSLELKKGTTSDMTFSGTTITQIFAPATFQVKTIIDSDTSTLKVNFTDINLIMKRYNM